MLCNHTFVVSGAYSPFPECNTQCCIQHTVLHSVVRVGVFRSILSFPRMQHAVLHSGKGEYAPKNTNTPRTALTLSRPLPCLVPADKNTIRFIPRENGVHSIDVKFNGSHIPGSPFKIRVGETGQAGDPGMVSAYGAGLEGGTTGETGSYRAATGLLPGCYWAPTGLLPGPPPAHNEGPTRVKLVALPFCVIPFVIGTNGVWLEERLRSTLLP